MEATEPSVVLIVEDEVLVRMAISAYLRECGYTVIEASSADEAIAVLESDHPVHVVFTDVEMPGAMNGFGLASWMRENKPKMPVILAGNHKKEAEAAADLCEYGPMLSKPYEPQQLLDQIRRLVAGLS